MAGPSAMAGASTHSGARARGRARPRRAPAERREREILAATLELLGSLGYERMSMDAVAARARAGKATLYRRWASKPELVVDAVRCVLAEDFDPPDTGELRSDLLWVARAARDLLAGEMGEAIGGVLGELRHNPELREALRTAFAGEHDSATHAVLARAVARGDIPAGADLDLIAEVAMAVLTTRLLVSGQPVDDAELTRLVDNVLLPAANAPPG